jgi:hypothetical protein
VLDQRLADLLARYGLTGTFYIARDCLAPNDRLPERAIAQLVQAHEVGAHTLTHPVLTDIPRAQAQREIVESGRWLADVTGSAITAFCYPRGAYNPALRDAVADAGYTTARTVDAYRLDAGTDPFALPTTVQIYPFPLRPSSSIRARFEPLRRALAHRSAAGIPPAALRSWPALAEALLQRAAATGGVWHLWGHSWEVERYAMWDDLERILAAASRYTEAQPVTNSELARTIREG